MTRAKGKQQLGAILVRGGLIDQGSLDKALESQVIFGGRLGTNLVDLRALSVEQVGRALSQQHGVPVATFDQMIAAPDEALIVINRELCARYKVLPFGLGGGALKLAMLDPSDLMALDELAFVTGKRIERYVAPELRLLQMLEKRYGIQREKRYLRVPDEGEQPGAAVQAAPRRPLISALYPVVTVKESGEVREREQSAPDLELVYLDDVVRPGGPKRASAPPVQPAPDIVGAPPSATDDEEAEDGDFDVLIEVDEPAEAAAAVTLPAADLAPDEEESSGVFIGLQQVSLSAPTTQLEEALAALDRARDRDVVIKWLIQPLLPGASCMLFMVRGQMAVGHAASETRTPRKELQGLVLPLTAPSLLQQAYNSRQVVRGAARSDPFQQMISRFLRWSDAEEVIVAPICHDDQVINLLCIQTPADTSIAPTFMAGMDALCARAAAAYARQIDRRQRPAAPEAPAPAAPDHSPAELPAGAAPRAAPSPTSDSSPPQPAAPPPLAAPRQPAASPRPAASASARPTLPTTQYFITGQLGARGPATIWRAIDTTTHVVVTIDLLPLGAFSAPAAQRLAQQVETLRRLEHPNLAALFGTGVTKEGQLYVVTEWLDGVDLGTRLERDALPPGPRWPTSWVKSAPPLIEPTVPASATSISTLGPWCCSSRSTRPSSCWTSA